MARRRPARAGKDTPMRTMDLSGIWSCCIPGTGLQAAMRVPGTLDENGIGFPDRGTNQWHPDAKVSAELSGEKEIATRFTRCFTYEGPVLLSRRISFRPEKGERVILEVERARHLMLAVNGQVIPETDDPCISAPHRFEITDCLTGEDEIRLTSDNSYPGWPHDAILYSSAATDETQTNWNGLLGFVGLRIVPGTYLYSVQVYPEADRLHVLIGIDAREAAEDVLTIQCDALEKHVEKVLRLRKGRQEVRLEQLPLRSGVRRWDVGSGFLYTLTAGLRTDRKTVSFGIRDFGVDETGHLTLNRRRVFLRGEVNCGVFPETGYAPMTVSEWDRILKTYQSYGVNYVRFHSYIPPEAAFSAADAAGMLLQPELPHWNPKDAFDTETDERFYRAELKAAFRMLANHPSFVMLTYGNELWPTDRGMTRIRALTDLAHALDRTRLVASASNLYYGREGCDDASDFYTSQRYGGFSLRASFSGMKGHLNEKYPGTRTDYSQAVALLREKCRKPVLSFEVGQYEVLPDFSELTAFHGVTRPVNYELIRKKVRERGLENNWEKMVKASGELALICYREEVEAALRTEGLSGMSLLGLQDFPGQGTALVGMLNAHMQPKPYEFARPERFRSFFRDVLPLLRMDRYTWTEGEELRADVLIVNDGRESLTETVRYELSGSGESVSGSLPACSVGAGERKAAGAIRIPLYTGGRASRRMLTVRFGGWENTYPIWIYPDTVPRCPDTVYCCRWLDMHARQLLESGGKVFLAPDSTAEALPASVQGQFSTDFWSVGTFPFQEGGMGQLIDEAHPLFRNFPTSFHTEWQWWPMAKQRAVILPGEMKMIVREMDSYAYLRPMAQLLECRCGNGRLLLSTMGLHRLQQYPEARTLLGCIYEYMNSPEFQPEQELTPDAVAGLVAEPGTANRGCESDAGQK